MRQSGKQLLLPPRLRTGRTGGPRRCKSLPMPVTVVLPRPVSEFVMVMVAPGRTDPVSSLTVLRNRARRRLSSQRVRNGGTEKNERHPTKDILDTGQPVLNLIPTSIPLHPVWEHCLDFWLNSAASDGRLRLERIITSSLSGNY